MSHNYFRTCLTTKDNKFFWQKPLASERFDKLIADRKFQKSIAHSRKNQLMYSFIESKIASDYALLIDTKLREQLKQFTLDDFNDISGFERKEKSNSRQQSYFKLRQELEFFLKNDIQQHKSCPDAQLNAFRRWINISDLLLRHHCYEGFLLVFVNLQLIADKQLIDGLPVSVRNNYNQLCQLSSPIGNHGALRHFMNTHQGVSDFTPLFFTYHAIGALDESLESLKDKEVLLKKQLKHLNKKISHLRTEATPGVIDVISELLKNKQQIPKKMMERRGHLIQLMEEVRFTGKQLKQIQVNMQNQLEQRANLVGLIVKEQKATPRTLPEYFEKTYSSIKYRFNRQSIATVKSSQLPESTASSNPSSSNLYKSKLLPHFWNRHGKSSSSYWEEVFTPSCLNNK
ncbi:TPA: Dot/Icm T4SS effector MavA [Legionella pneumophila subsp. pneumophila]|nr:Dot/Icm T4SS effector MavA [Legionella pneumophila subsp. pneumophila]